MLQTREIMIDILQLFLLFLHLHLVLLVELDIKGIENLIKPCDLTFKEDWFHFFKI